MKLQRLIQTMIVHPLLPGLSVATLFVPLHLPEGTDVEALSRSLGIEPISGGAIAEAELDRVLACLLRSNLEVFDMDEREFRRFVNESNITVEFLDEVQHKAHVLFEQEYAVRDSLSTVLDRSFGASLGQYAVPEHAAIHDTSGARHIELLSLIGASGLLICGSVLGLDRALHFGLYERIHLSLAQWKPTAAPD